MSIPKPAAGGYFTDPDGFIKRTRHKVPLIVGSIYTADEALAVLESGIPLVALGRVILINPEWAVLVKETRTGNRKSHSSI